MAGAGRSRAADALRPVDCRCRAGGATRHRRAAGRLRTHRQPAHHHQHRSASRARRRSSAASCSHNAAARCCGYPTSAKSSRRPRPRSARRRSTAQPGVFLMVQGQLGANTRAVTLELESALKELAPLLAQEKITAARAPVPARQLHRDRGAQCAARPADRLRAGDPGAVPVSVQHAHRVDLCHGDSDLAARCRAGARLLRRRAQHHGAGRAGDRAGRSGGRCDHRHREHLSPAAAEPLRSSAREPAEDVVLQASVEVRSSVVYATFIVALVFLPLLTLSGVAGKLFAPLGLAYIFAILASLVVALSLTPALCYLLLARAELKADDPPAVAWLKPRYVSLLRRIERFPGRIVSAVFAVIASGIALLPLFSGEFIPGAARRSLHHPHDGSARDCGVRVAAHRQSRSARRSARSRACSRSRNGSDARRTVPIRSARTTASSRSRSARSTAGSRRAFCARSAKR